jgi:hypothetical protein
MADLGPQSAIASGVSLCSTVVKPRPSRRQRAAKNGVVPDHATWQQSC